MNIISSKSSLGATQRTIAHYNNKVEDFWEGTKDHDVSQNITALLTHIQSEAPFEIGEARF
jgi:hypothetical protein